MPRTSKPKSKPKSKQAQIRELLMQGDTDSGIISKLGVTSAQVRTAQEQLNLSFMRQMLQHRIQQPGGRRELSRTLRHWRRMVQVLQELLTESRR